MPSDVSWLVIVLAASLSVILFARSLARAMARVLSAETRRIPPAVPAMPAPAAGPRTPQTVALARPPTPMRRPAVVRERPTRRLNLADARKGMVLATILGPCRARSLDEDHRP